MTDSFACLGRPRLFANRRLALLSAVASTIITLCLCFVRPVWDSPTESKPRRLGRPASAQLLRKLNYKFDCAHSAQANLLKFYQAASGGRN